MSLGKQVKIEEHVTESDEEDPTPPTTRGLSVQTIARNREYSNEEIRKLAKDQTSIDIARKGRTEHNAFVDGLVETQKQANALGRSATKTGQINPFARDDDRYGNCRTCISKWADIARAHASHEGLNLTPSGLANRFGPIPYRFPALTQLYLESPISQALIGRTTWDDPMIQAQANVVLGVDRDRARGTIDRHRFAALKAFKSVYQMIKEAERLYYEADSFFKLGASK